MIKQGYSPIRSRGCWLWIHKGPRDDGADPVDQMQIKSRCLQGGCFLAAKTQNPPKEQNITATCYSGGGSSRLSRKPHRPFKVRVYLQQPSSPLMWEKAKGLRGAVSYHNLKQPFLLIGLCYTSCPQNEGAPNPHPFQLSSAHGEKFTHPSATWAPLLGLPVWWGPRIFFKGIKQTLSNTS